MSGKTGIDMDELSPNQRTLAVLYGLQNDYEAFLGSWNLETGEYSSTARDKVHYTLRWLRNGFDLEVVADLIRAEKMRYGNDLIEMLEPLPGLKP